jgi:hypothetical protein
VPPKTRRDLQAWPHPWPPPPHDPRERDLLCVAGAWQVRSFVVYGPKFEYFAARSLWHLQLWHARARVSILTPSQLTGDCYEIFPVCGWKRRAEDGSALCRLLDAAHHPKPPSSGTIRALEAYFVEDLVTEYLARAAAATGA